MSEPQGISLATAADLETFAARHLPDVGSGAAWLYVEGRELVAIAVVTANGVAWPPEPATRDLRGLTDVRLFGDKGEWHLWPSPDGKGFRERLVTWTSPEWSENGHRLDRQFFLWGTAATESEDGWTKLTEARGVRLWFPVAVSSETLPLRLDVRQRLAFDDHGNAHVADAAFAGFLDVKGQAVPTRRPS